MHARTSSTSLPPTPAGRPAARGSHQVNGWLVAGILLVALNLRPALGTIGPLASMIRGSMGLSGSAIGLLTTLPLLVFGMVSMFIPLVTRRWGSASTLGVAMVLLAVGILLRSTPVLAGLFGGTILLGVGIAFGNVLLPSLVKAHFSRHYGLMTSLYSSMMGLGSSLAAGVSVPLLAYIPWGWRGVLGSWSVLALLALLVWLPQQRRLKDPPTDRHVGQAIRRMGRSRLAWNVAFFMGLQSFAFYVVLAWLPDMLQSRGAGAAFSGWMLSLSQVWGVVGSLVVPWWAGRKADQRGVMAFLVGLEIVALVGLILPALGPVQIWVSLIGFSLGGAFGLALFIIGARAADPATATELSGMAQSIGYLVAASGPFVAGGLFDLTGSWTPTLLLLVAVACLQLYTGLAAAKAEVISP